jgi:alkylation response protein AidB-like acyl-CoA dehydrogenase
MHDRYPLPSFSYSLRSSSADYPMDFELTREQRLYAENARRMVQRDIDPLLRAHSADRPLPKAELLKIYQVFAREGLTAPRLPTSAGGSEMRMLDYGLVFEQLPPAIANSLLSHEVTISRIFARSTDEQRERLLRDALAGRKIFCTATTEPDSGSDPRSIRTTAVESGDDLVLNGRKMWITNGTVADVILVTCSVGRDTKGANQIRRVVVEREHSSYESREINVLGIRQGHLAEIVFEDCRVPSRNALGEAGDAIRILTMSWNVNRPLLGLIAVGLAQRALDMALRYAGERIQFGAPIGAKQLVQERLADIATSVQAARLLCYYALSTVDAGSRANGAAAMAKRFATTECERAISLAMHVHGAMGLACETGLERLYRDVRMLAAPDATNEILTLIIGRELTGRAAF